MLPNLIRPPFEKDNYFQETILLIRGNGPNGSVNIIDSSRYGRAVTVSGNAQIVTSQFKFGGSSIQFDGTGDFLEVPASSDWNSTAVSTMIQLWAYWSSNAAFGTLIGQAQSNLDGQWFTYVYPNGTVAIGRNGVNEIASAAGVISTGSWYYLEFIRDHSTGITSVRVNNSVVAASATAVWNNSGNTLRIGAVNSVDGGFVGYLGPIRWTRTIIRPAGIPTAAFPNA